MVNQLMTAYYLTFFLKKKQYAASKNTPTSGPTARSFLKFNRAALHGRVYKMLQHSTTIVSLSYRQHF